MDGLDDAIELKRGNALVSILVSEGGQNQSSLLASLAGQMGSQWKTYTRTHHAGSTLGGQEAVHGVYTGLNRTGVGPLLKIVAVLRSDGVHLRRTSPGMRRRVSMKSNSNSDWRRGSGDSWRDGAVSKASAGDPLQLRAALRPGNCRIAPFRRASRFPAGHGRPC